MNGSTYSEILAVVVRYKMDLQHSPAVISLSQAFERNPKLCEAVAVLVWDNSPVSLSKPVLTFPITYRHSAENIGVSGAYNRALSIAESLGCHWLLLLDQDTTLTLDFLPRILEYSRLLDPSSDVGAIAPLLMENQKIISPMFMCPYQWRHARPFSHPRSGVCRTRVFASNSGTLMRVQSLRDVGGFDENFWLDISDVVVFDRLYRHGKRLYVAGDLRLQHRLTNNDYDGSMSPERYRNFIAAEGAYWDIFGTRFQNALQTLRLLGRTLVQYIRYRNKSYSRITREFLLQRLSSTKSTRIELWKQQSLKRDLPSVTRAVVTG